MLDARRPLGRLFYLVLSVVVLLGASLGQTPTTTTISDVVYRAGGTLAGGCLAFPGPPATLAGSSWPRGRKSVTLGPGAAGPPPMGTARPHPGGSRNSRRTRMAWSRSPRVDDDLSTWRARSQTGACTRTKRRGLPRNAAPGPQHQPAAFLAGPRVSCESCQFP